MAPVVRIEPNGSQTLLIYDGVAEKLSQVGWLDFVQSFRGFNLDVAKEFAKTFDGVRVKVGDVQFHIEEDFVAKATGLPLSGDKWFKNARIENIPWWSLLISKQMKYHVKGMPLDLFHPRWCNLLLIIKQFITCEGRYGLIFYFHIRLLMVFLGFHLDFPFYFLRILQKMARFYQCPNSNPQASLFHHGFIRTLVEHHLVSIGDTWEDFLIRNKFLPRTVILWLISHRMMKRYYPLSLYHGKFRSRFNSTITLFCHPTFKVTLYL
jgi:hypothetical protein